MTNYKDWDYNVEGNKMDKVCRRLLCDELVSDKIVGVIDVGDNNIFWSFYLNPINKDIKDSGLNNYTFYNFKDFFNELLDINMLYQYTIDSDDLKALYSCAMENIKKIKE